MNFQYMQENNSYDYKHVGSWDSGRLDLFQPFKWNPRHLADDNIDLPESVCSKPCEKGKVKVKVSFIYDINAVKLSHSSHHVFLKQ